jgi:glutamate synthase (NADPH) small chain
VAICGSGPAGLAAAADLVKYGCDVTVYEALHVVGGVLRYGIPSFRLPREIIDREVKRLVDLGVKIETNKVIGKTFTVPQLTEEMGYDAVFLGVGAGAPAFLGIPGEFAGQVYSANEFLTRVNLMGGDKFPYLDTPISLGKDVVVIGAGNTAMDCLRVAKRLGVPNVRCVYRRSEAEAPARIEELRHAKEEGIEFFFLHGPVEIRTNPEGSVIGMRVEKMALGEADEKGRRKPNPTGEFVELACDTVIYALGTKPNPILTKGTPGLGLNKWGNIAADDGGTQATTLPGVFAGGDIVTGGATVILAMGAGRRAARAIGAWLRTDRKQWPVTREEVERFVPPEALRPGEDAFAGALATGPQNAAPVAPALEPSIVAKEQAAVKPPARPGIPAVSGHACPKCHRPLEDADSGDYVCCAGSQLSWRCSDCAKVSEGFAFPYGLCPHCGGRLAVATSSGAVHEVAQDAVRIAFEIELGGMAFYARAAVETVDRELQVLFGKFAAMEKEHMATLSRRYHAQIPVQGGFNIDRAAIYAGIPHRPDDPANLFRIAIAFEQRAVKFFSERVDTCTEGSPERQLYRELAAEEREHVDLLVTEYERWKAGKPGLL